MPAERYINGICIISHNSVYLNGQLLGNFGTDDSAGFLAAAYRHFRFSYPKFYKMDRLSKLGWLAAEILLRDYPEIKNYPPEQVGLVLTNASASLDADLKYFRSLDETPSPALFVYTLPNIVIGEIGIRHNFKGENAFFITEHFNAALIAEQVNLIMDNTATQACICGWTELLDNEYKAALFLIEQQPANGGTAFDAASLNRLFNTANE